MVKSMVRLGFCVERIAMVIPSDLDSHLFRRQGERILTHVSIALRGPDFTYKLFMFKYVTLFGA